MNFGSLIPYLCKCSFTGENISKLAGKSWYKSTNFCKMDKQWLTELTLQKEKQEHFIIAQKARQQTGDISK